MGPILSPERDRTTGRPQQQRPVTVFWVGAVRLTLPLPLRIDILSCVRQIRKTADRAGGRNLWSIRVRGSPASRASSSTRSSSGSGSAGRRSPDGDDECTLPVERIEDAGGLGDRQLGLVGDRLRRTRRTRQGVMTAPGAAPTNSGGRPGDPRRGPRGRGRGSPVPWYRGTAGPSRANRARVRVR